MSAKSLLDILPPPKSNQNLFKPRTVTDTAASATPATAAKLNQQSKTNLAPQVSKKPEISPNAIISSKPKPISSYHSVAKASSITGNNSKIQKTGDFFGLSSYGNDTDEEEEEEIVEDKVINPVYNQYVDSASSVDTNSPVAEILKFEGKKRRLDNSIINIVDVNVKDVIEKNKEDLLKSLTAEQIKPARTMGTGRRHHQITYLAMMAKEREQELNKQWSDNKFNRKLSKTKYGF